MEIIKGCAAICIDCKKLTNCYWSDRWGQWTAADSVFRLNRKRQCGEVDKCFYLLKFSPTIERGPRPSIWVSLSRASFIAAETATWALVMKDWFTKRVCSKLSSIIFQTQNILWMLMGAFFFPHKRWQILAQTCGQQTLMPITNVSGLWQLL